MESKKSKQDKEILTQLYSTNKLLVNKALDAIKTDGNPELLHGLIQFYESTQNTEFETKIWEVLSQLREASSAAVIVKNIESASVVKRKAALVKACWHHHLPYENYVDTFIKIFINQDFEMAFDAYTVIENMEYAVNKELAQAAITDLKENLATFDDSKKALASDLVHTLEKLCS